MLISFAPLDYSSASEYKANTVGFFRIDNNYASFTF